MDPQPTTLNAKRWRVWYSTNYIIGGVFFLFGSILLYQYFTTFTFMNSGVVSAWLYTIGSFCFCLADFTQWTHYEQKVLCNKQSKCCQFRSYSLNFFTSLTGSIIYLVGSAAFPPQINNSTLGLQLFIVGSSSIFISQTWKVMRAVLDGHQKNQILKELQQDFSGFLIDLFAGLGCLMYFTGFFLFFNPQPNYQLAGTTIFSTGGFFFYLSGAFMLKRYFIQLPPETGSIKVEQYEIKFDEQKQMTKNENVQQIE